MKKPWLVEFHYDPISCSKDGVVNYKNVKYLIVKGDRFSLLHLLQVLGYPTVKSISNESSEKEVFVDYAMLKTANPNLAYFENLFQEILRTDKSSIVSKVQLDRDLNLSYDELLYPEAVNFVKSQIEEKQAEVKKENNLTKLNEKISTSSFSENNKIELLKMILTEGGK